MDLRHTWSHQCSLTSYKRTKAEISVMTSCYKFTQSTDALDSQKLLFLIPGPHQKLTKLIFDHFLLFAPVEHIPLTVRNGQPLLDITGGFPLIKHIATVEVHITHTIKYLLARLTFSQCSQPRMRPRSTFSEQLVFASLFGICNGGPYSPAD